MSVCSWLPRSVGYFMWHFLMTFSGSSVTEPLVKCDDTAQDCSCMTDYYGRPA